MLGSVSAFAAAESTSNLPAGISVHGYADGQFQWVDTTVTGFTLSEAALYFNASTDSTRAFVDIPINSSLAVAGSKTQVFLEHGFSDWLKARLGQFDSLYLQENLDSHENFFPASSSTDSNLSPISHLGLLGSARLGDWGFDAMVANPRDSTSMLGASPDFGARVGFRPATSHAWLGALWSPNTTKGWLIASQLKWANSLFDLRFGGDFKSAAFVLSGAAYAAAMFEILPWLSVGARGEHIRLSGSNLWIATLGPNIKLGSVLRLKASYAINVLTSAATTLSHSFAIGAIGAF